MKYKRCKICDSKIIKINNTYDLVKCEKCSLVFSENIYNHQDFVSVYDELYNTLSSRPQYANHSIKEFENLQKGKVTIGLERKKIINKHIKNFSSVLEIGSGIGLIGMYLKKYKKADYTGLEIDKKTHEKAISLGINSLNGDFSLMKEINKKFNTIMLWEVLEHLQDLKLFLELSKSSITDGGNLIFSVPNYNKRLNYQLNNNTKDNLYQSLPPVHLNFFTRESLKEVLTLAGFKINFIKIKKFPYLDLKNPQFYKQSIKSLFNKYHGSTIYVSAKFINKKV